MDPSSRLAADLGAVPAVTPVFVDVLPGDRVELAIAGVPVVIDLQDAAELGVALRELDPAAAPDALHEQIWEIVRRFAAPT